MLPRVTWWCLLGLGILTAGPTLAAQDSSAAELAWRRLPSNARLRIQTTEGLVIARFVALTIDTLGLSHCERYCPPSRNGQIRFPVRLLEHVDVQRGHRTLEGFILGLLGGAALGSGIGLVVGEQGEMRQGDMVVAIGLTGAIGGAIVGPIIGAGQERWKRLPLPAAAKPH
jgi:hypothetical protein